MKKQEKGPKKNFPVLLDLENYQKILRYADMNDTTLAKALNDMLRAYKSTT